MRGNRFKHSLAENIRAASPMLQNQAYMNRKTRLCWKCQKDKHTVGGHLKLSAGIHLFICAECMAAKHAKETA